MTIPQAIEIKEELEKIDELLKQLEEARETAQIAIIDMEQLGEFMDESRCSRSKKCSGRSKTTSERRPNDKAWSKKDGRFQLTPAGVSGLSRQTAGANFQPT